MKEYLIFLTPMSTPFIIKAKQFRLRTEAGILFLDVYDESGAVGTLPGTTACIPRDLVVTPLD